MALFSGSLFAATRKGAANHYGYTYAYWLRNDRASHSIYCPPTLIDREDPNTRELIPGSWRDDLPPESLLPLQPALVYNYTSEAKEMRQEFTRWFSDEEDVEWQRRMCGP